MVRKSYCTSMNYASLVNDFQNILSHSHFAVCFKACDALSMLSHSIGETLNVNLRPLLILVTILAKDKKLTKWVNDWLDSFFGNILSFDHVVAKDNSLSSILNEKKEKNTVVRQTSWEFLLRRIQRYSRGAISLGHVKSTARLCSDALKDSDAKIRKICLTTLNIFLTFKY